MHALHLLVEEHKVIQQAIALLQHQKELLKKGETVSTNDITLLVDFFQTYADRCHHGKEEEILFQRLSKKNLSPSFRHMMDALIFDHKKGRTLVALLKDTNECLQQSEKKLLLDFIGIIEELCVFYTQHILKENEEFFLPALDYFSSEELNQIEQDFLAFDQTMIHQKYQSLLDALRKKSSI